MGHVGRLSSANAQLFPRDCRNCHATPTGDGTKWIQAEHRVQPDLLIAQTGYMQGASGIGMIMLRVDAFQKGLKRGLRFPDSPFPGK